MRPDFTGKTYIPLADFNDPDTQYTQYTVGAHRDPRPRLRRVGDESDGYAEAWYLPAAGNIPSGYATNGTWYNFLRTRLRTRAIWPLAQLSGSLAPQCSSTPTANGPELSGTTTMLWA